MRPLILPITICLQSKSKNEFLSMEKYKRTCEVRHTLYCSRTAYSAISRSRLEKKRRKCMKKALSAADLRNHRFRIREPQRPEQGRKWLLNSPYPLNQNALLYQAQNLVLFPLRKGPLFSKFFCLLGHNFID